MNGLTKLGVPPPAIVAKLYCMHKTLGRPQQHLWRQYMETKSRFDGIYLVLACALRNANP